MIFVYGMKISHVLSFTAGVALMSGINFAIPSKAESPHHVYELRMYYPNPGKLEAVKARFRDHTDAIFKHHNMKALGYWVPEDAPDSSNLFIYLLEHSNRQEAEKNWQAFIDDPAWKKAKEESEVNGVLVENKNVHRYFMDPTTFSPMK